MFQYTYLDAADGFTVMRRRPSLDDKVDDDVAHIVEGHLLHQLWVRGDILIEIFHRVGRPCGEGGLRLCLFGLLEAHKADLSSV